MMEDFDIEKCLVTEVINAIGKMEVEKEQERSDCRNY
jgi:hypothetical protein